MVYYKNLWTSFFGVLRGKEIEWKRSLSQVDKDKQLLIDCRLDNFYIDQYKSDISGVLSYMSDEDKENEKNFDFEPWFNKMADEIVMMRKEVLKTGTVETVLSMVTESECKNMFRAWINC